jgi:hypothetical protein
MYLSKFPEGQELSRLIGIIAESLKNIQVLTVE